MKALLKCVNKSINGAATRVDVVPPIMTRVAATVVFRLVVAAVPAWWLVARVDEARALGVAEHRTIHHAGVPSETLVDWARPS
jgi:hypothetical protein